jgi:peroxiredoxin
LDLKRIRYVNSVIFDHLGKLFQNQIKLILFFFFIRYALVVDNNQVKMVFNETDNVGLQCSLAQNVLDNIKNDNLEQ